MLIIVTGWLNGKTLRGICFALRKNSYTNRQANLFFPYESWPSNHIPYRFGKEQQELHFPVVN